MSARQVSGMTIRSEEVFVIDLNEPESLLLPTLRESSGVIDGAEAGETVGGGAKPDETVGDGAEPGETVGVGEGSVAMLLGLAVPSELDVEPY